MRWPRTLVLYQCREIALYALIGFSVTTSILLSQHLLRRLDDLLVAGLSLRELGSVVASLCPLLSSYATPVAFLFGVCMGLSRLAADSEILAMRAGGLGLRGMLSGPVSLAIAVSLLTAWLMNRVEPEAQRELRSVLTGVAARGGIIEEGKFREIFGRTVYVDGRDRDNHLRGVVVVDDKQPGMRIAVFAERGRFLVDDDKDEIRLELTNGDLQIEPDDVTDALRSNRIQFKRLSYRFDLAGVVGLEAAQLRPREMTWPELRATRALLLAGGESQHLREREPVEYELQMQRRIALPAAPLLFALAGVPLALRRSGHARSWGAFIALAMMGTYYSLLSFGQFLAREHFCSAMLAMWLPNGLLALMAVWLAQRARRGLAW